MLSTNITLKSSTPRRMCALGRQPMPDRLTEVARTVPQPERPPAGPTNRRAPREFCVRCVGHRVEAEHECDRPLTPHARSIAQPGPRAEGKCVPGGICCPAARRDTNVRVRPNRLSRLVRSTGPRVARAWLPRTDHHPDVSTPKSTRDIALRSPRSRCAPEQRSIDRACRAHRPRRADQWTIRRRNHRAQVPDTLEDR